MSARSRLRIRYVCRSPIGLSEGLCAATTAERSSRTRRRRWSGRDVPSGRSSPHRPGPPPRHLCAEGRASAGRGGRQQHMPTRSVSATWRGGSARPLAPLGISAQLARDITPLVGLHRRHRMRWGMYATDSGLRLRLPHNGSPIDTHHRTANLHHPRSEVDVAAAELADLPEPQRAPCRQRYGQP